MVLNLKSLTLPEKLYVLNSQALSKVQSVPSLTLPQTLIKVGSNVFNTGAKIDVIYLNHYAVKVVIGEGSKDEAIEFSDDAFRNANVGKIVCGNVDVYNSLVKGNEPQLSGENVTVELKFLFYSSKQAAESEAPIATKKYFVGDTFADLPEYLQIKGLKQIGWYDGDLLLDGEVRFKNQSEIKIVPDFEITPLTFRLDATAMETKYDGGKVVSTLSAANITHDLTVEDGLKYEIIWTKDSAATPIEAVNNVLNLKYASESGVYKCTINYSYSYGGETYSSTITHNKTIVINRALIYAQVFPVTTTYGTYLTDADLSHRIVGILDGDKLADDGYFYSYHNTGDISVGVYKDELKIMLTNIVSENDGINVIGNYEIIYMYGDHTVDKKSLGLVTYNEHKEVVYGNDSTIYYVFDTDTVYGNITHDVKAILYRDKGNNVETYGVRGIDRLDNDNYTATFDINSTGTVTIVPKEVLIDYTILNSSVYTGKPKDIAVFYKEEVNVGGYVSTKNIPTKVKFLFKGTEVDEVINAGSYQIIAEEALNPNYTITNKTGVTFVIHKATPTPIYNTTQNFTYSGQEIYPVISISNNEQTPKYSCVNSLGVEKEYCLNAGIYTVNVTYEATDNYNRWSTEDKQPIELAVAKYAINLSPRSYSISYGETPLLEDKITVDGEELIVKYTTNATKTSPVGIYNIEGASLYGKKGLHEHPNYTVSILVAECEGLVKVNPRPVKIQYYGYTDLVYNGKEKNIYVYLEDVATGNPIRDVEIVKSVDEGIIKNAGTYHVTSSINDDRYEIINSSLLVFEVEKGTFDLSHIRFNDRKYVLDFKKHSLQIEGNLPEGVEVVYSIDGKKTNSASSFSHTVVASFIVDLNNYNAIDDMEATLHIDMSWLVTVIILLIIAAGAGICGAILYASYRREHPRKIKLKIKNVVREDLAAKRVATSVKEVLGDEEEKQKIEEELQILEDEDDLASDKISSQSFIERIYAANSELKYYYSEVKNELLSYEGITHSVDRKYEVFYHGTRTVAKLSICNGILRLYVNLDPQKYDKRQYNHRDMSKFECHEKTPLRINVNSLETLRHAKVFIRIIRKKERLESVSGFVRIDYEKFYTLKENFIPKIFKGMFNKGKNKKGK